MLNDTMHPTLNFTEAEFVQAGLLPATNLSSCTQAPNCLPASQQEALHKTFPDTFGMIPHEAGQRHQPGSPRGHPWSPLQQLTHRQVQDLDTVRACNDKKQLNREHQRKFRERQKAQGQALKAQLASTIKKLEDMELHKQELENRLSKQSGQVYLHNPATTLQHCLLLTLEQTFIQSPEAEITQINKEIAERAPDTVSIAGQEYKLSIEPWRSTPLGGFQARWKDQTHKLQSCLSTVQANPGRAAPKVRLAELVFEGLRLRAYHPIGNGSSGPFGATWLPASSDTQSTVHLQDRLNLSSKQVQDLLLVRRVYQLKLHGLDQQQIALASQMPSPSPYPFSDVVRVSDITAQLRRNAAERYQLVHSFIKVVYFGVFTMQQSATVLMEVAPDQPLTEHPINDIVEEQGLPRKQDMLADAADCLSEQDWKEFVQYAERVDCFKQLYHESVPIATFAGSRAAPGVTLY